MLDFHQPLKPDPTGSIFPEVGDILGDFHLRAELGRGLLGRVFLATQSSLADRPVVLKVTPCDGREHLSLARLQHTHIVPIYSVQDLLDRNLRVLCMPYLGGVTLDRLLVDLADTPRGLLTGRHILDALARAGATDGRSAPARGPARQFLAQASYAQAVCWIGACLADALRYAHERGLLHLDVKPSNVLLAADGQPMLLDFHLAHEPIHPDGPTPGEPGGTPGYMSPEQVALLTAVHEGRALPAVDGRSDIYSLGVLLFEALEGSIPLDFEASASRLRRNNPQVTVGFGDIIARCLASRPANRYPDAALLATDLQRHLASLPLRGVANRSPVERWRKWRHRRPHALARVAVLVTILAAALALGAGAASQVRQRLHDARAALAAGQARLNQGDYPAAVQTLTSGLARLEPIPAGGDDLRRALGEQLLRADRAQAAQDLHALADQMRLAYGVGPLPSALLQDLERRCRTTWKSRDRIALRVGRPLGPEIERRICDDLLDVGVLWADLRVRLASGAEVDEARRAALRVLADVEAMFGPSLVLEHEHRRYAEVLGLADEAQAAARRAAALTPRSAWEHYVLGRSLFGSGDLAAAAAEFEHALDLEPQGFWSNFYNDPTQG